MKNQLQRKSKSLGFWIKEKNIYQCHYTHIRFVINNPELFGITKEKILYYYENCGEQLYTEVGERPSPANGQILFW